MTFGLSITPFILIEPGSIRHHIAVLSAIARRAIWQYCSAVEVAASSAVFATWPRRLNGRCVEMSPSAVEVNLELVQKRLPGFRRGQSHFPCGKIGTVPKLFTYEFLESTRSRKLGGCENARMSCWRSSLHLHHPFARKHCIPAWWRMLFVRKIASDGLRWSIQFAVSVARSIRSFFRRRRHFSRFCDQ